MVGKVVVSVISIILVVGVVIGVVAGVHKYGSAGDSAEKLTPQMKAVSSICAPTDHKELCMKSLGAYAANATTDPKELIKAAVLATLDEMKGSFNFSESLAASATEAPVKMSLDDCKDLYQFAIDELQAAFSFVGDSDLHTVNDRVAEVQNWLNAVVSYQQSCLDGVDDAKLKADLQNNLQNATQLTSNVLAIVSEISKVLAAFDIKLNLTPNSRRLMSMDEGGYPSWFSAADRKLLAKVDNRRIVPNAVVAKDGSGRFRTIAAALAAYPKGHRGRYVIYVKAGVYDEYITVNKDQVNVFMYGDGPRRTIVTGHKNKALAGISTWQSATFSAIGNGFLCKSMGFQNTAGYRGEQAVALRVQSDMSAFFNCRMDGYQDTLYVQTHRQFYRNCVISGTVDFIFGDSATVIQNSLIIARKPGPGQLNTITAQGREERFETTGLVLHNCRIVPEQKLYPQRFAIKTYLGRPWKQYARTVIMESTLGDFIHPAGYLSWNGDNTCVYAEYGNRGPGARASGRVKWKGVRVISKKEAQAFAAGPFLQGRLWLKYTGFPFMLGLRY
ncbi:pectinesterase-like [Rhodamnia argentea]|uniref:Pectinesterase n=1 Tax=Rhodamnia argentea TaxID=178133 RepID=A0A8B8QXM5_9MYRT|nr:pectinesterase-like [Rhodamnia argentea]